MNIVIPLCQVFIQFEELNYNTCKFVLGFEELKKGVFKDNLRLFVERFRNGLKKTSAKLQEKNEYITMFFLKRINKCFFI